MHWEYLRRKRAIIAALCIMLCFAVMFEAAYSMAELRARVSSNVLNWVDFKVTAEAMEDAADCDIQAHSDNIEIDWIDLLSYLGVKYGGDFKKYSRSDMAALVKRLKAGERMEDIADGMKYYDYYHTAYTAVLGEMLGEYFIQTEASLGGEPVFEQKYGIKAYSPIAYGYHFSHCDDFGVSRSYGYKRKHLGHDMMSDTGTPIINVETCVVEVLGWNQYGGWRIGMRSLDGKRYYYYAHLRKGHPFVKALKEGDVVYAGDVIGYMGMTGYSLKEDYNGMSVPHLHFGIQLIFDESQKDSNEIWIDVYEIVKFLEHHKSPVVKNGDDFIRKYAYSESVDF